MDADDVCLPKRFERQIGFLGVRPDHAAVGTGVVLIDIAGNRLCEVFSKRTTHEEIDGYHLCAGSSAIAHPTAMIRRSTLDALGGYRDFSTSQDLDLWLRLGEHGFLANIPEPLLKYRLHSKSVSFMKRDQKNRNKRRILEDAYRRRGLDLSRISVKEFQKRSVGDLSRRCAAYALAGGALKAARRHALQAVCRQPHRLRNWAILGEALCGKKGMQIVVWPYRFLKGLGRWWPRS
jgi:hypothetical protein